MKTYMAVPLAVLAMAGTAGAALAAGDAAKGETAFTLCRACHTNTPGAVGPNLTGVVGRVAGSDETFAMYSAGMKTLHEEGLTWDEAKLDEFLANPAGMAPGTLMAAVPDAQQRQDLIAYLSTLTE